jgi:hypothetical protein
VPHCFIYVWRYVIQCRGVDDRPGDSGGTSWHALYLSGNGFEGGGVGAFCLVAVRTLARGCG